MSYEGSIELIGGLKPKNDGNFKLVNAKDIYQPVETSWPEDSALKVGVMYFLSQLVFVGFKLPKDAKAGDMVYAAFTTSDYITGDRMFIEGSDYIGISEEEMAQVTINKTYELMGIHNGTTWMLTLREVKT